MPVMLRLSMPLPPSAPEPLTQVRCIADEAPRLFLALDRALAPPPADAYTQDVADAMHRREKLAQVR